MDHVDVNLIRQLVSVEKYIYAQVSDYLKTKYPNSRGFSERTVRRYRKENEIYSRTDAKILMKSTEWLQMQSVR